ncbi:hypothetical protein BT69DRAFT_1336191 [Atractiella rhizophila]|nr:hypothetical protein BT69DRAFT_1336191 [Atractiella rhizophila]
MSPPITPAPPVHEETKQAADSSSSALKAFNLVSILTTASHDEIQTTLEQYPWEDYKSESKQPTPLIIAVRCAKTSIVELVSKLQPPELLNYVDSKGQTALHSACSAGRLDVVNHLLSLPNIDDTIRDLHHKIPLDICRTPAVAQALQISHAHFQANFQTLLRAYVSSPAVTGATPATVPSSLSGSNAPSSEMGTGTGTGPTGTITEKTKAQIVPGKSVSNQAASDLYIFLSSPRAKGLDFSHKVSDTTLLHEAARRRDLALIKLAISRGADVLVRDRRGRFPVDVARDDRVKGVLKQTANAEGKKWEKEVKEREKEHTRMSLSVSLSPGQSSTALVGSSNSSLKEGLNGHAMALNGNGIAPPPSMKGYLHKWVNMATRWKMRWFVLENGQLSYFRSQDEEGKASRGSINMGVARVYHPGTDKMQFEVCSTLGKSPKYFLKGNHPLEVSRWMEALRQNIEYAKMMNPDVSRSPSLRSSHLSARDDDSAVTAVSSGASGVGVGGVHKESSLNISDTATPNDDAASLDEDTGEGEGDISDMVQDAEHYRLLGNGMKTQLEIMDQVLDEAVASCASAVGIVSDGIVNHNRAEWEKQLELHKALKQSVGSLERSIKDLMRVVDGRERNWERRMEKEVERKKMWEESMKEVALEHKKLEDELARVTREASKRKKAIRTVRASIIASSPTLEPSAEEGLSTPIVSPSLSVLPPSLTDEPVASPDLHRVVTPTPSSPVTTGRARSASVVSTRFRSASRVVHPSEIPRVLDEVLGTDVEESSEDEDDFFDAIETGSVNLKVETPLQEPTKADMPAWMTAKIPESYKTYEKLRESLPLKDDQRPPVSLWAILKGSIGKDLTKISFPVYFNEPTSMLERMAEDMEFSECLDAAAASQDSTLRIAYVAAFAMSNYSSTIGRIAKPFNPMLSETFEYVRLDKSYRYISEQVCHHPPISACIAESPRWQYFGEVDAKSKFMGKSFEIRPTGIAHANLRLPKAWAPDYPLSPEGTSAPGETLVLEHYSWKKVITNISNFIMGSPQIDHYGDMEVTNHRTGEKCVLTFKPRGWRGKDAYEIRGYVADSQGRTVWDIAGRWNSQLVARRHSSDALSPDAVAEDCEAILLWKNSPKPPGSPFNLTPFAITLNGIDDELKHWLPPTDCRLRPDQHAFESGAFEKANNLKSMLEEHQRETRRKREQNLLPPHKPRWFKREKEPDTGEGFWKPLTNTEGDLEYWIERERAGKERKPGEPAKWRDVDPIFADF